MKKYIFLAACALGLSLTSCEDFLDYTPTAVVDEEQAFSEPEKMVNSAYAMLGDCWYTYPFNLFPYGDVSSDDCLKGGSGTTDTGYHAFDIWTTLPLLLRVKWMSFGIVCMLLFLVVIVR